MKESLVLQIPIPLTHKLCSTIFIRQRQVKGIWEINYSPCSFARILRSQSLWRSKDMEPERTCHVSTFHSSKKSRLPRTSAKSHLHSLQEEHRESSFSLPFLYLVFGSNCTHFSELIWHVTVSFSSPISPSSATSPNQNISPTAPSTLDASPVPQ